MDERRLLEDEALNGLGRALLRAGREAEPSAESSQRLLQILLPQVAALPSDAGNVPAARPGASGISASAGVSKWAALGVLGAALIGAPYALQHVVGAPVQRNSAAYTAPPNGAPAVTEPAAAASTVPAAPSVAPPASGSEASERAATRAQAPRAAGARPLASGDRAASVRARPGARARAAATGPSASVAPHGSAEREASVRAAAPRQTATVTGKAAVPPSPDGVPRAAAAGRPDTELAEELRQLDGVRRALGDGNQSAARQLLSAYFQRFPSGYLAPEARRLDTQVRERWPRPARMPERSSP